MSQDGAAVVQDDLVKPVIPEVLIILLFQIVFNMLFFCFYSGIQFWHEHEKEEEEEDWW